jgi:hypothetical protein
MVRKVLTAEPLEHQSVKRGIVGPGKPDPLFADADLRLRTMCRPMEKGACQVAGALSRNLLRCLLAVLLNARGAQAG